MATNTDATAVEEAADNAARGTPARDVRNWLHQAHHGTLGTHCSRSGLEGFPHGSIVPFCVDQIGRPVVLIANIAAHTKNLKRNPQAFLFVSDPNAKGDPQSSWRGSLMGSFQQLVPRSGDEENDALSDHQEGIDAAAHERLMARYVQRVPNARAYLGTHGFSLWRMNHISAVRYIAGFGRICWVKGEDYLAEASSMGFAKMEEGARVHMNEDHEANMVEICKGYFGVTPERVQMAHLDASGFALRTEKPDGLHHVAFAELVAKPADYKMRIIECLRTARKANA